MDIKSILKEPHHYLNVALQEVELRSGLRCSKPSQVWLKLTERCNCRCHMCDIWRQNQEATGELTTQNWKDVLWGLRQWLGKRQIWLTGGEPFLRPDCIELIEYGSSLGLSLAVITNGIILSPKRMPLLVRAGLKEYHNSIDSVSPEIHDRLRGIPEAHKRASRNVVALKEFLEKNGIEMKIVIKTIIMGYNVKEILPLVDWTEKNHFDEIKFQPLESNLEGLDEPLWFKHSPYWPQGEKVVELAEVMTELIRRKQAGGRIHNSVPELLDMREYFLDPVARYEATKNHTLGSGNKTSQCRSAVGWMEILSRGGLRMCRHMPPQGDIRNSTPREFWMKRPACWKDPVQQCFRYHAETDQT